MSFSWSRLVTWIVALLAGGVFGVAGTIAHAYRVGPVPVGLILAVIGAAALLLAVRLLTRDRWAALACGFGLFAAILVFSGTGPGGSVIVPSGKLDELAGINLGLVWTIAVPVMTILVVVWPDRSRNGVTAGN